MRQRLEGGFTVIEIAVGIIAASILASTVGIMLVYGYKCWIGNNRTVQMHRDATLAMQMLGNNLRGASAGGVNLSQAAQIDVSNAVTLAVASFYQDGASLVYNPNLYGGGSPFVVVKGQLTPSGFTHSNTASGAGVTLALQDGAENVSMNGIFHYRN